MKKDNDVAKKILKINKNYELFEYYNLDEVIDRKLVLSKLKKLKNEGKIEYDLNEIC